MTIHVVTTQAKPCSIYVIQNISIHLDKDTDNFSIEETQVMEGSLDKVNAIAEEIARGKNYSFVPEEGKFISYQYRFPSYVPVEVNIFKKTVEAITDESGEPTTRQAEEIAELRKMRFVPRQDTCSIS